MHIVFIGCGKMGAAILSGWKTAKNRDIQKISIVCPSPKTSIQAPWYASIQDLIKNAPQAADVLILATLPQTIEYLGPELKQYCQQHNPIVISIAALKTLDFLNTLIGSKRLFRVMPNIAVRYKEGSSALVAYKQGDPKDSGVVQALFKQIGYTVWCTSEKQFNALTPIIGCSPAFVFYFLYLLTKDTMRHGISEDEAHTLSQHILKGCASMLENAPQDFTTLINMIAKKGGVTEAGLNVLQDNLPKIMEECLSKTHQKASETQ